MHPRAVAGASVERGVHFAPGVRPAVTDWTELGAAELRAEIERRRLGETSPDGNLLATVDIDLLVDTYLGKQRGDARERGVYGVDSREDHFQLDRDMRRRCDSVAALFYRQDVVDLGNGRARLRTRPLRIAMKLCPGQAFAEQPSGAFATAFVAGRDLLVTAAHAVKDPFLAGEIVAVFGFYMVEPDVPVTEISNQDVYPLDALVDKVWTPNGPDWAVARVGRPFDGRRAPLPLRTTEIARGEAVYTIGHPSGLPVKRGDGARVLDASPAGFFCADLDAFGGNSGSPVFDAQHRVAGILARGEADFIWKGGCRVVAVLPTTGLRGEECTRISEARAVVP